MARPACRAAQHHDPRDRPRMSTWRCTCRPTQSTRDWSAIIEELDDVGCASDRTRWSSEAECSALIDLYDDDQRFRSTIDMARHRFGEGQYRYFAQPLAGRGAAVCAPPCWPHLLGIARTWYARLDRHAPWPDDFDDWLAACHRAGQHASHAVDPALRTGDWNALHRDLYGDLVFPLQVVVGLDEPGDGLHRRRVRRRRTTPARAVAGDRHRRSLVVTRSCSRHATGRSRTKRGWSAAPMRHGASIVRSGHRHALGLIFHDAA